MNFRKKNWPHTTPTLLTIAWCLSQCTFVQALATFPFVQPTVVGDASSRMVAVDPAIGTAAGQMYPDFLLPTVDGKWGRLSDYRGKKVLLVHFASW